MPVKFILRDQEYEVKPNMQLRQAIRSLGLQPDAYLSVRNGELITEDEVVREGDVIKLVAVISGGNSRS